MAEDGGNGAKRVVDSFNDSRIFYLNTEANVGRSKIGNMAMERANGSLFNFLDDDDFLLHDHLETLVNHQEITGADACYAVGLEAHTSYTDEKDAATYKIEEYMMPLFTEFSRFTMATMNFLPIQTVLFKKELFLKYGGFNEDLEFLEDWDLWYRYSINNNFRFYPKLTSIYKVPFKKNIKQSRQVLLDKNYKEIRDKYNTQNLALFGHSPEMHIDQTQAYLISRFSIVDFLQVKTRQATLAKKLFYLPLLYFLKIARKIKG